MSLHSRYEYAIGQLDTVAENPFHQLREWLAEAEQQEHLRGSHAGDFNAMCLSTVGENGQPSARFVLLRGLEDDGLRFFSNYLSRKGHEIAANPFAAATFWWPELQRQVRLEGKIALLEAAESDAYFQSRPRESQLASAASPQSQAVDSREQLESLVQELAEAHPNEVPRPEQWGGYRLVPHYLEFWQGRAARLHDRLAYTLHDGEWEITRLAP